MSIYINNKYRIKRSATQQEMMQKLRNAKIFEDYRDILMISAVVGYINNTYIPLEKVASDGVLMQFFNETDYDIIDMIAYAHKKEQLILKVDEKYEIFSAYVNGGFPLLLEALEINEETNFDENDRRNILTKYYTLLLSQGLYGLSGNCIDDLTN